MTDGAIGQGIHQARHAAVDTLPIRLNWHPTQDMAQLLARFRQSQHGQRRLECAVSDIEGVGNRQAAIDEHVQRGAQRAGAGFDALQRPYQVIQLHAGADAGNRHDV